MGMWDEEEEPGLISTKANKPHLVESDEPGPISIKSNNQSPAPPSGVTPTNFQADTKKRLSISKPQVTPVVQVASLSEKPAPKWKVKKSGAAALKFQAAVSNSGGNDRFYENDQLKQQKKQWEVGKLSSGGVANKIKAFAAFSQVKEDPKSEELVNTRRTNPALKKRREAERKLKKERERLQAEEEQRKYFAKNKKLMTAAAIKIQSVARMKKGKSLAKKRKEQEANRAKRRKEHQAATILQTMARSKQARNEYRNLQVEELKRQEKARQLEIEKLERELENAAAVHIQSLVRAGLTRVRVAIVVDELIDSLLNKKAAKARSIQDAAAAAAALEASQFAKQKEEEERFALAAVAREQREMNAKEAEALVVTQSSKGSEEDELLAQAAAARDKLRAEEQEKARQKAREAGEAERERIHKEEAEKLRREAAALEKQRRQKMNLFVGPLPWGVALLPDWWMHEVPHQVLFLESINEDDTMDGEDFQEWRKGNIATEVH